MKIFIDTSAWVALQNKKDIHYNDALTFKEAITNKRYSLYTSNFILDEHTPFYWQMLDMKRQLNLSKE